MKLPGKKVAILGLGISGLQSALFLHGHGFRVWVSDLQDNDNLRNRVAILKSKGIGVECGRHSEDVILQSDWVLISPGISPAARIYQLVRQKKIPVMSEIEVASWFCPTSNVIAVTGTCGKTTVTTLITQVLKKKGLRVVSCGNIGNPWIGELAGLRPEDFVVLELSSFQLEHCASFHPRFGILLNISANHEDWHRDIKEYTAAKLKLFEHQTTGDVAFLREQDQKHYFPEFKFKSRVVYFDKEMAGGILINPNETVVGLVTGFLGCGMELVREVCRSFEGIEHRLEKFHEVEGISFVNDSKSTTTASLQWALEKYSDHSVVLIAGGHPKSRDFYFNRELIAKKVKKAILIGEARPLLHEAWQDACPIFETDDFRESIQQAYLSASAGDVVLLSPACASFDMFQNYEDRGYQFKNIVREVTATPKSSFQNT